MTANESDDYRKQIVLDYLSPKTNMDRLLEPKLIDEMLFIARTLEANEILKRKNDKFYKEQFDNRKNF